MAPATELATLPLVSGATIEDPNSSAGKVWQSTLDTVSAQDGFQRAYYGREVENPSVLQLFIDWNSLDDHHAFMKSAIYGPFGRHLMTIVEGPMSMYHTNFDPHPPSAAISSTSSPVTEVITCYFASHDPGFEEKVKKLAGIIKENTETFKAAAGGWIIEDVEHESIGSGTKGKAYAVVFGWDSVEAHMKFRETEAFKENIHLLREGPLKLEVHHTKFVEK